MATLVVTNTSSADLYIADLYTTIPVGGSVTCDRKATDIPAMSDLQAAIAAGNAAMTITYSSDELATGLHQAPRTVEAADIAPVDATALGSGVILIRKSFAAAAAGMADDVTIYALGVWPYTPNMRIVGGWAYISTAIAMTTLKVYSLPGAMGTQIAEFSSAAVGVQPHSTNSNVTQTVPITPASTVGLFIRRSDRGVAGEVFLLARFEN